MKLFERANIGELILKNRIVMAALNFGLAVPLGEGELTQRAIDFYVARARGGVGLIVTTFMRPNRTLETTIGEPAVNSRRCISWLNDLAEAIHDYGVKVCVQLSPGLGRIQPPNPDLSHGGAVSASPVPNFWAPNILCRELTIEEIEQLVKDFEFSCNVISSAGIDAIEIHGHQGYLADEFMTALWNKRTDKYGGDLDGRLRFPLELVAAAKRGGGTDFPVLYRYGLTHYLDGGRGIEEGLEIARKLETAGVDALDIDCGCYETNNRAQPPTTQPPACMADLAEMTKKVVKVPVITAGKLGYPNTAERLLEDGKADFIALGRSLLADPDWPNKVKGGRLEDIIPCIGDQKGCTDKQWAGQHISCSVNPSCGLERESAISSAQRKKSVLVIGGGPAGMEAARVSALRGHEVTLWEKGLTLGGNLIPAAVPDFKQDYKLLLDYQITQIRKLGITVKLGMEATPEIIQKFNPEVVFVATGATPVTGPSKCTKCGICDTSKFKPNVCYISRIQGLKRGIETGKVVTAVDALLDRKRVGDSVTVVGGGLVGCETGLWLAQEGKRITIVARHDAMCDMNWINALDLKILLDKAKVKVLTFADVLEITDEGVTTVNEHGERSTIKADTVLLAGGMKPNTELLQSMQDKLPEVYAIGDCVKPRQLQSAFWEGFRIARLI